MRVIDNICLLLGRLLMGSDFILPGLQKITHYYTSMIFGDDGRFSP